MDAAPAVATPWAFWSPSPDATAERALALAKVGPGTRFLDLGCGDGRILVAAARLGARVRGLDINAELAHHARSSLQAAGLPGEVEVGDMFATEIDADVVYAYLTPVVLSRLRRRLSRAANGTRVVTPRYPITGWKPARIDGGCYLYVLPTPAEDTTASPGWGCRAALLVLPANRRVLSSLTVTETREKLALEMDPQLGRAGEFAIGEPASEFGGSTPVDVIFGAHGVGSVIAGEIQAGSHAITVAAVFARGGFGHWSFGGDQGPQFRAHLDSAIAAARNASG